MVILTQNVQFLHFYSTLLRNLEKTERPCHPSRTLGLNPWSNDQIDLPSRWSPEITDFLAENKTKITHCTQSENVYNKHTEHTDIETTLLSCLSLIVRDDLERVPNLNPLMMVLPWTYLVNQIESRNKAISIIHTVLKGHLNQVLARGVVRPLAGAILQHSMSI